ncbi:MAG: ankyrin repeat domain-containing protein [Spirochaetales bacterium]|nr:ankyrin repeat domain-containing protein [Spirochaetales bacterium]
MKNRKWFLLLVFIVLLTGCKNEFDAKDVGLFFTAINNSDYGKVEKYIRRYDNIINASFNVMGMQGNALFAAIGFDDIQMIKLLIKEKINLEYNVSIGATALLAAVQKGNIEYVELLLEAGADICSEDNMEMGVYHYALYNPSIEILDLLYEYSELIDEPDDDGTTPLLANMSSRHEGRDYITLWFLKKGADFKTVVELVPEMVPAFIYEKRNEVNKYLIENTPSYRNYIDPDGQTVSHFSVEFGNDEVLDCLLENKYYSNAENDKGETPLKMAVRIEREDMVEKIEEYLEVNP